MCYNYKQNITREEINELPVKQFDGEIYLIDTLDKFYNIISEIKSHKILGFDTETKPAFVKGQKNQVAIIQLSSSNKAYIIRVSKIGFPLEIANILSDPKTLKIGADIKQDLSSLNKICPFKQKNFIDIQKFSGEFGIEDNGLKKIAAIVLGVKISKSQRLTNWELPELTSSQLTYAATDAWVCYEIYNKLQSSKQCKKN